MAAAELSYSTKPVVHLMPVASQSLHKVPMPEGRQCPVLGLPLVGLHSLLREARPNHTPSPGSASSLLLPQPTWQISIIKGGHKPTEHSLDLT